MSKRRALLSRNVSNKLGWEFEGRILVNTTSEKIWNNKTLAELGVYMEKVINHLINSVKSIKRHKNYLVDKHSTDIN